MKKNMFAFIMLSSFALSASNAMAASKPLDQMVAVVNDDLITRSELDQAITAAKMQITRQTEQLINKKLQLQAAAQSGIVISDQDVDNAIHTIASQNNVSVDVLYEHVAQQGLTPALYKTEIHDQIVLQKLQQHEVAGKVTITQDEVTNYMKSLKPTAVSQAVAYEYRLQDILVPTSDTPSKQQLNDAKVRATAIKEELEKGVVIEKLPELSGSNAAQTEDIGWRKIEEVPSQFVKHVTNMKKNSVAGPIEAPNGMHVIVMKDMHQLETTASNANVVDRKSVEAMLLQQKFDKAVQSWVSRLRSQAFISASV
jgi:peptidyl-prolyl cis-trans isomerase SurA